MSTKLTTYKDWLQLLELAEAGENIAQYEVAFSYDYGHILKGTEIVKESKSMAFKWYCRAYENGNLEAIIRIADFLSEGIHCKENKELAIELYQKGITNGSSIAANNLATVYRDLHDYKRAFEYYKISQDLGNSNSLSLALCYYFGIGTERNLDMSFLIFNKISENISAGGNCQYDVDEANYFLGKIYLDGAIVEKSISKARIFLRLANADGDHHSAQELLLIIGRND